MAIIHIVRGADEADYSASGAVTVYDAAQAAGLISRDILAAKVDGKVVALSTPVEGDALVTLLTFDDPEGARVFRHTASHILAQAVKRLYPEVKLTIGPAIDDGFYYDVDSEHIFTPDDFEAIEAEMRRICKAKEKLERF